MKKYRNKVKDLVVTGPEQVYVSDITYIATREGFCYLSLITDRHSRRIMGWDLSQSLAIEGSLRALTMALRGTRKTSGLIHHSDRGIQYCSKAYVELLQKHGAEISMTEENHVYENALAERVNGILKDEFLLGEVLGSYADAKKMVAEAIETYNNVRLHMAIGYMTPAEKHAA
jgi:transposase InsO family protein